MPPPGAGERQGGSAAVRALPRRRPGARPGDALDRRGHGERGRPADCAREGGTRRGRPLPTSGTAFLSRSGRGQAGGGSGRSGARRARLRADRDRGDGADARAAGLEIDDVARWPTPSAERRRSSTSIRSGRCDLVVNTPQGSGRTRRRLPHPRGGARRACRRASRSRGAAAAVHAIAQRRAESALSLQERDRDRRMTLDERSVMAAARLEGRCRCRSRRGRAVHAPAARRAACSSRARPASSSCSRRPGALLPRPISLCLAPRGELAFLVDPIGPGTRALCDAPSRATRSTCFGPLGNGFDLDVERPLLVGGGIGIAPLPYLAEALGDPPAILGFRSERHAEAAALLPERRGRRSTRRS